MEGQSKWRGRDPAEEKKSSSDEVLFLDTLSKKREVITLCAQPGGEREGRGRGEGGEWMWGRGSGWRGGMREEHDTFGFGREDAMCHP